MPHPPQIPLTPQTDERNFPRWEGDQAPPGHSGHRYPKMLTKPCTKEERTAWVDKNRRVDRVTRDEYWEEAAPRVGSQIPILSTQDMVDEGLAQLAGQPLIVNDKEEEIRVRAYLGVSDPDLPVAKAVNVRIAEPRQAAPKAAPKAAPVKRRKRTVPKARVPQQPEVVEELE